MAQILMPKLGLTMTEGQISEWRVGPGSSYEAGDVLFVVETEKVANEVQADAAGVIEAILVSAGETVSVGTALARLEGHAEGEKENPALRDNQASANKPEAKMETSANPSPSSPKSRSFGERVIATPLARRIATLEGVELRDISGSGPNGRIKAKDVREAASTASNPETPVAEAFTTIAVDANRAATARRVSSAKQEIPHFYVSRQAEISALQKVRADLNSQSDVRVSVTHMLAKGLALALAEMSHMNRIWVGNEIYQFSGVDIGIVSETRNGLRLPMLRDVQTKSLDEVATEAKAISDRITENALMPSEVGGGAISISNVGMFGVDSLTPIISPPQSMILGVGSEQMLFRPGAHGAPQLAREITLTLACDHRVIDGADAARFLSLVAEILEKPARLFRQAAATAHGVT